MFTLQKGPLSQESILSCAMLRISNSCKIYYGNCIAIAKISGLLMHKLIMSLNKHK